MRWPATACSGLARGLVGATAAAPGVRGQRSNLALSMICTEWIAHCGWFAECTVSPPRPPRHRCAGVDGGIRAVGAEDQAGRPQPETRAIALQVHAITFRPRAHDGRAPVDDVPFVIRSTRMQSLIGLMGVRACGAAAAVAV